MRSVISAAAVVAVALGGVSLAEAQFPAQAVRMAYTVEPFTPPAQITIKGTGVRLRAEPFASQDVPVLSHGSTGLVLNVVGITRLPDWNWYQVVLRSGQKAFIRSDYTSAPSKGGSLAAPLPPATRIEYPPASSPAIASSAPVSAPAPLTPAPVPLTPPVPTYTPAPAYTPAPTSPASPPAIGGAISPNSYLAATQRVGVRSASFVIEFERPELCRSQPDAALTRRQPPAAWSGRGWRLAACSSNLLPPHRG